MLAILRHVLNYNINTINIKHWVLTSVQLIAKLSTRE